VLRVVDVQTASIVIAAAAVGVAAVSIIMQNRKAEKARRTQLMMQLFGPLRNFEFIRQWVEIVLTWEWKDFDEWMKKYFQNPNEYPKFIYVTSFFNSLGLLLKMKLIDFETISSWHPEAALWLWEKVGPMIQEGQRRLITSGKWSMKYKPEEWFEYLVNEMKKREQAGASSG